MIDTRLHTLLTLMEAGSYTKAARVLSLTQPAVSHHIRQLEQEYGAPVFYRSTKQLKLTPEGGILVKYARRMQASSYFRGQTARTGGTAETRCRSCRAACSRHSPRSGGR